MGYTNLNSSVIFNYLEIKIGTTKMIKIMVYLPVFSLLIL